MRSFILYVTPLLSAAGSVASPVEKRWAYCPPGFRNTVFNTGAPRHSGWPHTTWDSLTSHGVGNWMGFTLDPPSANPHYSLASGQPAPTTPSLNSTQIPICMDPTNVPAALAAITSLQPPAFLELFNEPDYSWKGLTPLTSPAAAAAALAPLFATKTTTRFISPATAFTDGHWLATFRDHCKGCFERIPIISAHIYSPNVGVALARIKGLHDMFPEKRIWITELAPASGDDQGCTLDARGVIAWMRSLLPQIVHLGYVDKVFWNNGEWGPLAGGDPNICNPSLTHEDGSPTPLLKAYAEVCA